MGGEGTIAGMIISLRNNANLRLGRKKYFTKDNPYLAKAVENASPIKHIKRTPQQIEEFHIKEDKRKRRELTIQLFAFVIAASLAVLVLYFIFGTTSFT